MELPRHRLYIGGKWVEPSTGEYAQDLDPATNQPIAEVASGGAEDAKAAVEAARAAFDHPEWRGMDPSKRGRLLYQLGQAVRDRFEEIAKLESQDVGKPIREAKGDAAFVYKTLEYWAGMADKIEGTTIPVPGARLDYTLREPVGVTVHIAPWNYPLTLAVRGIAPALAAGNTVVLKPAAIT
ncbi:MAG TPA: aldehyde dehydrogenase family protein, partial [Thermoplasmata archaeon]|nr:aldehyde dehydrogenase family protein [Thermoplasmata archaeon]